MATNPAAKPLECLAHVNRFAVVIVEITANGNSMLVVSRSHALRATLQSAKPIGLSALNNTSLPQSRESARNVRREAFGLNNIAREGRRIERHKLELAVLRPTRRFEFATVVCFDDSHSALISVD